MQIIVSYFVHSSQKKFTYASIIHDDVGEGGERGREKKTVAFVCCLPSLKHPCFLFKWFSS